MTREEAKVLAKLHRQRAKRAWHRDWNLKAEAFWNREAERVAGLHGLTLQVVMCAGVPIGLRYI